MKKLANQADTEEKQLSEHEHDEEQSVECEKVDYKQITHHKLEHKKRGFIPKPYTPRNIVTDADGEKWHSTLVPWKRGQQAHYLATATGH